jgi:hypothetical protein
LLNTLIKIIQGTELTFEEKRLFKYNELNFEQIKEIVNRAKYSDSIITNCIIEQLENSNVKLRDEMEACGKQKFRNKFGEEVSIRIYSSSFGIGSEKIMRYERSLQKSKNIFLLKQIGLTN